MEGSATKLRGHHLLTSPPSKSKISQWKGQGGMTVIASVQNVNKSFTQTHDFYVSDSKNWRYELI